MSEESNFNRMVRQLDLGDERKKVSIFDELAAKISESDIERITKQLESQKDSYVPKSTIKVDET